MFAEVLLGRRVQFNRWLIRDAKAVANDDGTGRYGTIVAITANPTASTYDPDVFKVLVAVEGTNVLYTTAADWLLLEPAE